MKIEWASHFRSDGTRRRPPPSTMHGWLAKMRGTLIGNESLRSKGMREMRDARARKRYIAKAKQQKSSKTGRNLFSFLGLGKHKKKVQTPKRANATSPPPSYRSRNSRGARSSGKSSYRQTSSYRSNRRMPGHYELPRHNSKRVTRN